MCPAATGSILCRYLAVYTTIALRAQHVFHRITYVTTKSTALLING